MRRLSARCPAVQEICCKLVFCSWLRAGGALVLQLMCSSRSVFLGNLYKWFFTYFLIWGFWDCSSIYLNYSSTYIELDIPHLESTSWSIDQIEASCSWFKVGFTWFLSYKWVEYLGWISQRVWVNLKNELMDSSIGEGKHRFGLEDLEI